MERHARTAILGLTLASALSGGLALAGAQEGEIVEGREWKSLLMVTGFRSVKHKKTGLEARLIEADGSASVAQDPIGLFLVVTNNGSTDLVQHAWRIRRGVARVRELSATDCGVDVKVDVDRVAKDGRVAGTVPKVLRLCFLSSAGKLQPKLLVTEISR